MASRATMNELAAWLKAHDDFVLLGHVNPDGDATGSTMAMMLALRDMGKRAYVCLPGGMPKMYSMFHAADEAVSPEDVQPFTAKAAFALDTSEELRLGSAGALFADCETRAVLDHHETNPGFGDVCVVDGARIACGELVLELIEALGAELTKEIAEWLYIAISTDSGHFSYGGTNAATMNAAGRLIAAGADVPELTRELYHTRTRARTQLLGVVLAELEVSDDGKMAWARATEEMMKRTGATSEDKEGIVNYLLEIEGVEFAALAEERGASVKLSLRSKQTLDVAGQVAVPLGGGGHRCAAGCTLNMSIDEALETVLAKARKALN